MKFPVRQIGGDDAAQSAPVSSFALINLESSESFVFNYFPAEIETSRRANWERANTATRQALTFANIEPKRVDVPELWLDGTRDNQSLTPTIRRLYELQELGREGAPPALLVSWGDREERVILEEVRITELQPFDGSGNPLRARVSLTLIEVQQYDDSPATQRTRARTVTGNNSSTLGFF
ncbi:MAG: hypothetical protein MSG64_07540 [Pyrinomonadaceae bacterium MAG19_C2-C3]|nr:hypothetical protein [Pyrinomonadaceae bacterium MAG19_C2-C3]